MLFGAILYLAVIVTFLLTLLYHAYSLLRSPSPKKKTLKLSEIYVYPVKSLRPTQLTSALATKYGFEHDRRFMLVQVTSEGYKNMQVSRYPEMTQFLTSLEFDNNGNGTIIITHRAPGTKDDPKILRIPIAPNTEKLQPFDINLHSSATRAWRMPDEYINWFSKCFGYDVVLVYLGDSKRPILFQDMIKPTSLLSSIAKSIPIIGSSPLVDPNITFADCAPYLITSKTSLADVSARLPDGQDMDMTKFRPNIVVEGADKAWEEDYWRRIKIRGVEITMPHNCLRCQSVNVDYATGKPGTGESGEVLKKLQKDRRIDTGSKWSPVFGRYGFWYSKSPGTVLKVGDEVEIVEVNKERTIWCWPNLQ